VAVLLFENRARDTAMTLLAEGLADQIATDLGRIERLQVSSPASVRYTLSRGARDPRRIGQALGARWLVDGQLLSGRGTVRVSVQLIEAARGTMRWSNSFQRPTDDLLGLIRMMADSVATAIIGELAPSERAQLVQRPTTSGAAYDSYLRGRASLRQGSGQNLLVAGALFAEATTLDSSFVDAWAALASTWVSTADNILAPRAACPRAREFANRALRLDAGNGEATAALAKVAMWYDWDLPGAVLLARRAVALGPGSAETHLVLGLALTARGDTAEATSELLRALDLDSLSGRTANNVSLGLLWLGRYDELETRGRRLVATEARVWGYRMLVYEMEARGRCQESAPLRASLTYSTNLCTERSEAEQARVDREVAENRSSQPYFRAWGFARRYAPAGAPDQAMEMLEQAYRDREAWMPFIQFDPAMRSLFADPRFQDLVRRIAAAAGGV
jgi:TolB-like protein